VANRPAAFLILEIAFRRSVMVGAVLAQSIL
jgi:hypothetical protein